MVLFMYIAHTLVSLGFWNANLKSGVCKGKERPITNPDLGPQVVDRDGGRNKNMVQVQFED